MHLLTGTKKTFSVLELQRQIGHKFYDPIRSYARIKDNLWCHIAQQVKPKEAGKVLPWVHTMISNAKRTLLGAHHMVLKKYFQNYLDEFCYEVNRRYFGEEMFDRLLIACTTINYKAIVKDYQ